MTQSYRHILVHPQTQFEVDVTLQRNGWPLIAESPSPFVTEDLRRDCLEMAGGHSGKACLTKQGNIESYTPAVLSPFASTLTEHLSEYGWVIGVEIFALDPFQDFKPSHGVLTRFDLPNRSETLHIVSACEQGATLPDLGTCLAEIIARGDDRGQALKALRYALDSTVIEGVATTLPLQLALLSCDEFERGDYADDFLSLEYPKGFGVVDLGIGHSRHIAALCAILSARTQTLTGKTRWVAQVNSDRFTVELDDTGTHIIAAIDEDSDKATIEICVTTDWTVGERVARMCIDDRLMIIQAKPTSQGYEVRYRGGELNVDICALS